jgi:hypothetical protein
MRLRVCTPASVHWQRTLAPVEVKVPIPTEYSDIINILLEAAREGRVRWQGGRYAAVVSVSGSQFAIWAGTDEETGDPFVAFALQDPQGESLDNWYVDQGDVGYEVMRELHQRARRQTQGIPQRLESLKKALKSSKVIGEEGPKKDETSS